MTEKEARNKVLTRPELTLVEYGGTSESEATLWKCNKCGGSWRAPVGRIFGVHKSGCPHCAPSGFNPSKPATFYAYKIDTRHDSFLGFGITGNIETRDYHHQRAIAEAGAVGTLLWTIDCPYGQAVKEVEAYLKTAMPIVSSGVVGFIDEAVLYSDEINTKLKAYVQAHLAEDNLVYQC